ncbi:hypothetical protein CCACVL1_04530 [Corchorus capsularis]|uniref:Myb/SANT-like domain-containing protein n=1 Tax=Corchorus capsularis TaxID=210143 RepID=A0A1R3JRL5_COCAP|nr:hypothetical protein CCACVL1_04530 [Corchorus capsularis]
MEWFQDKSGHGFNPVTNTVDWTTEQWDDYIKKVPEAKQLRYVGLQFADEMRSLFDDITATGQESWGPSKQGLPKHGAEKPSSSAQPTVRSYESHIDIEPESPPNPLSPAETSLPKKKHHKKNNDGDLDEKLLVVLNTLEQSDGPSIEECNKKLDEMETLHMEDPLYLAASCIFCESKAYHVFLEHADNENVDNPMMPQNNNEGLPPAGARTTQADQIFMINLREQIANQLFVAN